MWWRRSWFSLNGKVGIRGYRRGTHLLRHPAPATNQPIRATRLTEGLIGSIIGLLDLDLSVPDHTTLSRRAETLEVPRPRSDSRTDAGRDPEPLHLLVDSTGLKLCGPGEWLVEKHGTKARRSWRKLHLGRDADTGQIVAATLATHDGDDGSQVGPLLRSEERRVGKECRSRWSTDH